MKSILIIIESPLKMRYPVPISRLPTSNATSKVSNNVIELSKRGKMRQIVTVNCSENVLEVEGLSLWYFLIAKYTFINQNLYNHMEIEIQDIVQLRI